MHCSIIASAVCEVTPIVAADDFHIVALGIRPALAQLTLDGFLTLVITAVSGVYCNITGWYFVPPLMPFYYFIRFEYGKSQQQKVNFPFLFSTRTIFAQHPHSFCIDRVNPVC